MINLYHYVHCPFCVRVRMAMGYLNISYTSNVLAYNDEITPVKLSGKKMLPIIKADNDVVNESLDIINFLDVKNQLDVQIYLSSGNVLEVEKLLAELGSNIHNLAMPYWMWTPEFDDKSRQYFKTKKEMKRGPFSKLVIDRNKYIQLLNKKLADLEFQLCPFYKSKTITLEDILISSHLWGMFIVPEFQFSNKIYEYLTNVGSICNFSYHEDYWK